MTEKSIMLLAGQRHSDESSRAVQACNDYLRMGPNRSLRGLAGANEGEQNRTISAPFGALARWSARYGWQTRAEEFDARLDAEKTARAREIMETGLTLSYERVAVLKELASFLHEKIYAQDEDGRYLNLWKLDVKQIGSGKNAEKVIVERFNGTLIGQYRAVLADLAKETGGRTHKSPVNTSSGVSFTHEDMLQARELLREFEEEMAQRGVWDTQLGDAVSRYENTQ